MRLAANQILKTLNEAGYEAYLVGGYVRNTLLNLPSDDIDITTNCLPETVMSLFDAAYPTGIDYGTITVVIDKINFEVTTYRSESDYDDNRRPTNVNFSKRLEDDLSRRDFTINAMAMTLDNHIIDLYNGRTDLLDRIIRTVNNPIDRLSEDALRILRAIRFATQYNFKLEPSLSDAIKVLAPSIKNLSYERKLSEINKIFTSNNIDYGIDLMIDHNIYLYLDGFTKEKLSKLNNPNYSLITKWAILDLTVDELYLWKHSKDNIKKIILVNQYLKSNILTLVDLYKLGIEVSEYINQCLNIYKDINLTYQNLIIKKRSDINITSNQLIEIYGEKGGPWLSELYQVIEENIINGKLINDYQNLVSFTLNYKNKTL